MKREVAEKKGMLAGNSRRGGEGDSRALRTTLSLK